MTTLSVVFRGAFVLAALTSGSMVAAEEARAPLVVQIAGAQPPSGQIMLTVFDSAAGFLKAPLDQRTLAVTAAPQLMTRIDLAPGVYALSAVHDENANGKLDTNLLGIPTESVGFSNDASALFGPPGFDDAAITLPPEGATITINLGDVD